MNTLICPKCHGNKLTLLPDGSYKCAYCGNVFQVQKEQQESKATTVPTKPKPIVVNVQVPSQQQVQGPRAYSKGKSKGVAAILALFFGGIGIHWFYLGKNKRGVAYLLFFFAFCWTWVVPIILSFAAFLEFLGLLFMSRDTFNKKYNTYYI